MNGVRSGQFKPSDGFEYWQQKFDGVRGNRNKELSLRSWQEIKTIMYKYCLSHG
jgi:hypothetical protein